MDRLSYIDGYLKGIYQSLNILLDDGIITKKQWNDYKDKFFNGEIVVPEKYQFINIYNRNYIKELKQISERRDYMQTIIPLIKEIERKNIYAYYNYKDLNDMLVNGAGIKASSASEINLMSNYFYNYDGSIKPEWDGFKTRSLTYLARLYKDGILDIYAYRKSNSINPTMKTEEIKNFVKQLIDERKRLQLDLFEEP